MLNIAKTINEKKLHIILLIALSVFVLVGCSTSEITVTTSNLTDETSRSELDSVMEASGVSSARRSVFWNHVEQFNNCEGITGLTDGYEKISLSALSSLKYDEYAMKDAWEKSYPNFVGYDCRITVFSLMGDYINIADTSNPNDSMLFMDKDALEADNSALFEDNDLARFLAFFSIIQAEDTNDSSRQAEVVQKAWKERGITFDDNASMSLITVFLNDKISDTENELMIGHTGVLFTAENGELYFVEKLAFQLPYRVTKFASRSQLKEYLMAMYDVEWGQTTAPPFIFENGELM